MKYLILLYCTCSFFLVSCTSNSEQKQAVDEQLKVMTFNIRLDAPSDGDNNWKYRKNNVAQMIKYYQPDLLGMQEVCHNQMEDLKQSLPQYTALGVARDDGKEAGEYCPIFFNTERFDVVDYGNFSLSENPDSIGLKGWDASYNRITTWCVLKDKNTSNQLVFFNTHLDNDGKVARNESVQLIMNKIKEIAPGVPAIITGDFNCTPDDEPLKVLEAGGMMNALTTAKVTYGSSWSFHDFGRLAMEERVLLDYIFTTTGAIIDRYRVIEDMPNNSYLSDHHPVMVDVTFHK